MHLTQWTSSVWHTSLAQAIDRISITECGVAEDALMEAAGEAVARTALDWGANKHPVIVLAGRGNNGADGLVAARILKQRGVITHVILTPSGRGTPLFEKKLVALIAAGVRPEVWHEGILASFAQLKPVVIDALTGLGFKLPPRNSLTAILKEAHAMDKASVIAVDLPSGIDADRGDSVPILTPTVTVTFGAVKPCHVLMPASGQCGTVLVADIGFPTAAEQICPDRPWLREVRSDATISLNPWLDLPRDANKYDRGHVLIIGGSPGKIGAAVLSGLSALRAGAGWVSVAIPDAKIPVDRPAPWELTLESFFDGTKIDAKALKTFISERKIRSVVIGPGWMGQCLDEASWSVLRDAANRGVGLVIDAGALHGIADILKGLNPGTNVVLTPHPGEWKKLSKLNATPLPHPTDPRTRMLLGQQFPLNSATLVYKDAAPIIADGDSTIVCSSGSNILARAGTGDVLTGVIAAHLARGCGGAFAFARSYVVLSQAALRAAHQRGHDGVIASDLIDEIGLAGRI